MASKKAAAARSPVKERPAATKSAKPSAVAVKPTAVAKPAGAAKAIKPVGPVLKPSFSEKHMALTMASRPRDELIRNWELALALELKPTLDTNKLNMAFRHVLSVHSRLRCVYFVRDGEVTVRTLPIEAFELEARDASAQSEEAFMAELNALHDQPWNSASGPLIKLTTFKRPKDRMVLLLRMSHLMVDGWSIEVLLRDMIMYYLGVPSGSPNVPGFDEFVAWEASFLQTHQGRDQREFWKRKLARVGPRLKLPYDRQPASEFIGSSGTEQISFDRATMDKVREVLRRGGGSVYSFMLAVYQILLTHLSGQTDLTIIATTARRNDPKFANTIGMMANVIAFRNSVTASTSFLQHLTRANRTIIEALERQDCHMMIVGDDLSAGSREHSDNFGTGDSQFDQVALHMMTPNQTGLPDAGLRARFEPNHKFKAGPFEMRGLPLRSLGAHRDLTLFFNEIGDGLIAVFTYNADLFDASTAAMFAAKFTRIAELALEQPERTVENILAAL